MLYPLSTWERRTYATGGSASPKGLFPTPTASAYGTGGNGIRKGTQKQVLSLQTMASRGRWPTPTAKDADSSARLFYEGKGKAGITLTDAARVWPVPTFKTPTTGEDCNLEAYRERMARKTDPKSSGKTEPTNLAMQLGGLLNPTFVEWLMGFPEGASRLEPWAMQWYRPKREKRSRASQASGG